MDIGQRKREFSMQTNEQTKREGITYSRMSWKADVHAWLICPISGNYSKDLSCPKAGMTGVH